MFIVKLFIEKRVKNDTKIFLVKFCFLSVDTFQVWLDALCSLSWVKNRKLPAVVLGKCFPYTHFHVKLRMKIDCFCCTILHTIDIWYYHLEMFYVWNMILMDSCVCIPYSCHNIYWPTFCQNIRTYCALTGFFWLFSHVIYLKLTRVLWIVSSTF